MHRFRIREDSYCENPEFEICEIPETLEHYLLCCPAFSVQRQVLRRELSASGINEINIREILRYGITHENLGVTKALLNYVRVTGKWNKL